MSEVGHHIRLATLDDVPGILAISNHYALTTPANFAAEPESLAFWEQSWHDTHDLHPWLVACPSTADDDQTSLLGFAKSSPWKGRCAYNFAAEITIYLDEGQRGRGLGRALYARLFELLDAQGYRTAIGGITLPNESSVRLHESFGMTQVAQFKRNGWKFDRWHDVGYWQMHLGPKSDAPPQPLRPVRDVLD